MTESSPPTEPATLSPTARRTLLQIRLAALGATILAGLAFALFVPLPDLPLCSFRTWTGHPCPGCGMTRSIVHLGRGDVVASLRFHPLGIVLAGGLVTAFVGTIVGLLRGDDPVQRVLERRGVVFAAGLVAALAVIWLVRAFVVPEWSPNA